jgi:hypothetical protein
MHVTDAEEPAFERVQRNALLVGGLSLAACVAGAFFDSAQFFRSYLVAYLFCLGLALGSLGVMLLHNLVGGRWGALIRQILRAAMGTLPLMAILVIPLILGIPALYIWARPAEVAHDALLQHKQSYLNVPFFVIRTILYFCIWIGLSFLLNRRRGPEYEPREQSRARMISAPGLILFSFTVTFAAVDWVMSLEPHWFSTIYGAILLVGQTLSALSFSVILLTWMATRKPFVGVVRPELFHDLGNLIFAFTVLWAYTSVSQLIIIWSGNIPEETPWYIRRSNNGWQFISAALALFHFAVPFFILLSRRIKRRNVLLARVAAWMMFMRLVDLFYWIQPSFSNKSFSLHWMDLLAPVGLGGIWLWLFILLYRRGPLLNVDDPRLLPEGAHH